MIIRPGAIGDTILALPAMESLRADYTEVWVASQNVPLIRIADCVRSIASTGLDWLGIPDREPPAHTLDLLRGFDSIVSWYGTKREEFRAAVSRFPFAFLQALPEDGTGLHATDYYLRQIEELRCESGTRRPACPSPVPPVSGNTYCLESPASGAMAASSLFIRFQAAPRRIGRCNDFMKSPAICLGR